MTTQLMDNRMENFKQILNHQAIKHYGIKLNVGEIKELGGNKYKVAFNYNKMFNIVDDNSKMVFVRNIYFKNVYATDIGANEELSLPLGEINKSINDEFIDLRQNLFQKVIADKKIMIRILKTIHTTSAFLNKFYTLLNDLFYCDKISKSKINNYIDSDKKYSKYIKLIIDSEFAEYTKDGDLKASNKFKMLIGEHKKEPNLAVEEAISKILSQHYEYIVYELGIKHIKPYINIIVARTKDKDNEMYKKIVKAYNSDEVEEAIKEVYKGAALPAWK